MPPPSSCSSLLARTDLHLPPIPTLPPNPDPPVQMPLHSRPTVGRLGRRPPRERCCADANTSSQGNLPTLLTAPGKHNRGLPQPSPTTSTLDVTTTLVRRLSTDPSNNPTLPFSDHRAPTAHDSCLHRQAICQTSALGTTHRRDHPLSNRGSRISRPPVLACRSHFRRHRIGRGTRPSLTPQSVPSNSWTDSPNRLDLPQHSR